MSVAGIRSDNSNYYNGGNSSRNRQQGTVSSYSAVPSQITLHMSDEKTGEKALTSAGYPNGGSTAVFLAEGSTEANPKYRVKFWDADGTEKEYYVNPKEVDPSNASYIEMLAYTTYADVSGKTSDAFGRFLSASGGVNGEISYDSYNIDKKANFKSLVQQFMQMQYDANNLEGYLAYKQLYDYMEKD